MTTRGAICIVAGAVAVIAASVAVCVCVTHRPAEPSGPEAKADTVYRYRTVYRDGPSSAKTWSEGSIQVPVFCTIRETDTVYLERLNTIHDTCYVILEKTHEYYNLEDGRLRVWISGVQPSLDRYEVDFRETVITKPEKAQNNRITIEAAPRFIPSVQMPVTLEYARKFGGFEVFARGGYEFVGRTAIVDVGGRYSIGF